MATATLNSKVELKLTVGQIEQVERDGYFVARGLFSPEEISTIRETFMRQNENGPIPGMSEIKTEYTKADPLSFYPRMMHPHEHQEYEVGPLALRYMLDARLYGILKTLMRDEPVAVQSMFYFKPAGARGQAMHQDNYYLRVSPGTCMAAWIAVDDADFDNGGMMVVPGTHTREVICPKQADRTKYFTSELVEIPGLEPQPIELKAGDVLFFNGSLVHGSSPNASKHRFRCSLIMHYIPETSVEVSEHYRAWRFDGERMSFAAATGGGPCGTPVPAGAH